MNYPTYHKLFGNFFKLEDTFFLCYSELLWIRIFKIYY